MSCLPLVPLQAGAGAPGGASCRQLAHTDLHTEPGGYLREVLTAKVYDVAVTTPLQRAEKLRWVLQLGPAAAGGARAGLLQGAIGACCIQHSNATAALSCVQ